MPIEVLGIHLLNALVHLKMLEDVFCEQVVRSTLRLSVCVKVLKELKSLFYIYLLRCPDGNQSISYNFQRFLPTHILL